MALLAALPIVAILALMLGLRWSAARAGLAGLGLAALLAPVFFGFGQGSAEGVARGIAGVAAEGGFTTLTILWILLPALALHHHQESCGALETLRRGLAGVSDRPLVQVLLVGWFLALFFEGAAGFGTPVALAAPLLVGMGVAPVQAVVLALLGHAVGVSFGALGTPVLAQAAITGLEPRAIAWRTAAIHVLLGGVMMAFFVRAAAAAGIAGERRWPVIAAVSFLLPALLLAWVVGPELATLGAALLGGMAFVLLQRRAPAPRALPQGFWRAVSPYLLLVALVMVSRAWPAVAHALGSVTLEWRWMERFSGRMTPLTHPGTLLMAAWLLGAWVQGVRMRVVLTALARAVRRLLPVSIALFAMLCLSRLMLHGGLIAELERAAVRAVGAAWPLLAPAVGALGSFVTGSATASNVLFTSLQAQTAASLGVSPPAIVAAQGVGAAVGNIVCPHNIVAGGATVGLAGREADILRHTVGACAVYLVLAGVLVWALLRLAPALA